MFLIWMLNEQWDLESKLAPLRNLLEALQDYIFETAIHLMV